MWSRAGHRPAHWNGKSLMHIFVVACLHSRLAVCARNPKYEWSSWTFKRSNPLSALLTVSNADRVVVPAFAYPPTAYPQAVYKWRKSTAEVALGLVVLVFFPPAVLFALLSLVLGLGFSRPPSPLPAKPGLAALAPLVEPKTGIHKRCYLPNDKAKLGQVGRLGD